MRRVSLFLPALIALFLYLPSLSFDRTLDDLAQVPSPDQKTTAAWTYAWTHPYWSGEYVGGGLYRPVTSSSFWLESRIGAPLWARHLVNVVLYALVTGFVARMAMIFGFAFWAVMAAGLLFAVHPTHVETVAGLVGRAEILAALGMLIALHLHDRVLRVPVQKPFAWVLAFTGLAFLAAGSKESAWLLALFALPLHARHGKRLREGWPAFAGYAAGLLGHLLLRRHILGGWLNAPHVVPGPDENPLVLLHGWDRLGAGLRVAGVSLGHLVFPVHLSPDYTGSTVRLSISAFDPAFLAGCSFLVICPALLVAGWRRRSTPWGVACLAAGIWIGTAFLLTMNVFLNLATILADRLLFWPSAGWSLLVGASVFAIAGRDRPRLLVPAAATVLLASAYAAITLTYLPVWKNNLVLFDHARRVAPTSPRIWSAYGKALTDSGRTNEALAALHESQRLSPRYLRPWAQEAGLLIATGRLEEAKAPLREALRIYPGDIASRINEAILWLYEGKAKDSVTRLREILNEAPRHFVARKYLALALEQEGTPAEAEAAWRSYLELDPQDAGALNSLARILATEPNRAREAEELTRRALAIDPSVPEYHDTLGEALVRQGKFPDAAAEWRAYLKQVPDNAGILNDLAWILATELGAAGEAEALARKAVGIAPKNPDYRDTLAESLARQGKTAEAARVAREALTLDGAPANLRRFLPSGSR